MSLTGTVIVRPLCSYASDHFMLAFPFRSLSTPGLSIFSAGPFAGGAQPSQGWLYSWELGQIERSDSFQPGGEGTLAAPIDIPAKPRTHLSSLLCEAAAGELYH